MVIAVPMGVEVATSDLRRHTMAKRKTATKTARKSAAKRERIDTGTDKRFVRRGAAGKFEESDDVGRAARTDQRTKAKRAVKAGQGDKGDRKK
jgi:hypothetical protein